MLTSHSSWEEWFPPRLRGLAYLTSHIFTMVASALLWDQRSEFQTSWVITDFLERPLLTAPNLPPAPQGHYCEISSHCQVFLVPPLMILAVFLLQRYSPITHSFLPSPVRTFSHSFLPLSHFHVTTDDSDVSVGLLGSVQSSFPPSFIPPTKPPMVFKAAKLYSHWSPCMRVNALFLLNEGPERKCILVPSLSGSSWLLASSHLTSIARMRKQYQVRFRTEMTRKKWAPG